MLNNINFVIESAQGHCQGRVQGGSASAVYSGRQKLTTKSNIFIIPF